MRLYAIGLALSLAAASAAACDRMQLAASTGDSAATSGSTAAGATDATAVRELTIPAGTALPLVLDTPVGSDTSRVEQAVRAHLSRAIVVKGVTALPAGSVVTGIVTDATRSGKVKGRAHVALRFSEIAPRGEHERYDISARPVARVAPATKKKDAAEIGAPAAGGALIGALVGGKKGAAIGAGVGGGAGTAVVLSTRGKEVRLRAGAPLTIRLSEPLTVRVAKD